MMGHLGQKAAELGLPFGERKRTYNSRLAQELGAWAESKNQGHAFHMAAFKAYFVDGKNIAKISVLLDLSSAVGLSRDEAAIVLSGRTFKTAVDKDWQLSKEKGVTAVPTFVLNRDRLVGAQPYHALEKMMIVNGVEKRDG
jgi:predicted DsbA family dithiol-disulfide isomerase